MVFIKNALCPDRFSIIFLNLNPEKQMVVVLERYKNGFFLFRCIELINWK